MNFIEFIGFVITMFLLLLLMMKRAAEERRRREHPEEYQQEVEEEERALREFLKSMNIEVPEDKEEKPEPEPRPKLQVQEDVVVKRKMPKPKQTIPKSIDKMGGLLSGEHFRDRHQRIRIKRSLLHSDAYLQEDRRPSKAQSLLRSLKSNRDMVILHEVFGPPKGKE